MSTWRLLVTVLLLIHPALSQHITSTCEIPSVEAGENATLTIFFGQDLSQDKAVRDFSLEHIGHSLTASQTRLLDCEVSNGEITCDKTPCCTWESQVTNSFRVYIHSVSQEHEGRFWGFLSPADLAYQKNCNFSLKASTCPTDSINATNSHMNCSSLPVTIGQTCRVTCNPSHYFQENQTTMTYTCVGKNKWSPEMPITTCEAYTCNTSAIIARNSHVTCSSQTMTIGHICTVTCSPGFHLQEKNQSSETYTCVWKNKWSPEIYVTSCEENAKEHESNRFYVLFILLSVPIVIVLILFIKRSNKGKGKERENEMLMKWIQCVDTWYPALQSQTYFLPPIHFNREGFCLKDIAGEEVLVPLLKQSISCTDNIPLPAFRPNKILPSVTESDVRDDRALQLVLRGINELADNGREKEVMMVVSQLQFGKYFGEPSYAPAAAFTSTLPESLLQESFDKGHFDILIIHRQHGLLTLQINSVEENLETDLSMEVEKVAKQLNKAERVLKDLTSDLKNKLKITKCLVMPNIKSSQLKQAIKNSKVEQLLRECLGAKSVDDAVNLCLLKEQLSDNQTPDINPSSLQEWWKRVRASRSGSLLTPSLYEQLVARFCGPATTVEVHCVSDPHLNIRILGDAVSATGERVARLVLFPQQVDILNQSPPLSFLSGPPGTGKTIVLIMQGLTWLQRKYDVHVVSTCDESRAATFIIEYQLQKTAKTPTAGPRVHQHQFHLKIDGEVEEAVSHLKSLSEARQLCVIADEVVGDGRKSFTKFCDKLTTEVPEVFIWGASVYHGVKPPCLKEFKLTTPLRSPPVVVREVMEAKEIKNKQVHDYTVSDFPFLTDGPPVIRIKHCDGQVGHTGILPLDCAECGHQVARVLTELNVGRTGDINGPPPLQYRDVLVLCDDYPTEDRVDNNDEVTSTAIGLVRGLRDRHVSVRVVEKGDEAAIRDTALGVGELVTVAKWDDVQGLERKVVVVESGIDWYCRLYYMSRCTSQLVLIDCLPH